MYTLYAYYFLNRIWKVKIISKKSQMEKCPRNVVIFLGLTKSVALFAQQSALCKGPQNLLVLLGARKEMN